MRSPEAITPPNYEVNPRTGCWNWTRGRTTAGYGEVTLDGRAAPVYAHRLSYEQTHGEIPEGLQIDHLCGNPPCVNPGHLEAVSNAENTRRGKRAKLDVTSVRAIRASNEPRKVLAERYGIHPEYVTAIRGRRRWAEV